MNYNKLITFTLPLYRLNMRYFSHTHKPTPIKQKNLNKFRDKAKKQKKKHIYDIENESWTQNIKIKTPLNIHTSSNEKKN